MPLARARSRLNTVCVYVLRPVCHTCIVVVVVLGSAGCVCASAQKGDKRATEYDTSPLPLSQPPRRLLKHNTGGGTPTQAGALSHMCRSRRGVCVCVSIRLGGVAAATAEAAVASVIFRKTVKHGTDLVEISSCLISLLSRSVHSIFYETINKIHTSQR